jgi:hypothetical protein
METSYLMIIGAGILFWGITLLALIDIILKDFGSLRAKVIWIFVASVPILGWIIYLLFGYRKGIRRKPGDPV